MIKATESYEGESNIFVVGLIYKENRSSYLSNYASWMKL